MNKKVIIIIVLILMVISIGVGAYFILKPSTTQTQEEPSTQTRQESSPQQTQSQQEPSTETPNPQEETTSQLPQEQPLIQDAECSINAKSQEEVNGMIKSEYYEFDDKVLTGKEIKSRIEKFALSVGTATDISSVIDSDSYYVGNLYPNKQITTIKPPIGNGPQCLTFPSIVYKSIPWQLYDNGDGNYMPYRLNANKDIECMSFNNWDCYWGTRDNALSKINNPPAEATKPNVCTSAGYNDRNHWCNKGMKVLNPTSNKLPVIPTCSVGKIYNEISNSCVCSATCPAGYIQNADCTCVTDTCRSDVNGGVCSTTLTSSDGSYRAVLQSDGNFVIYDRANTPIWSSSTYGKGVAPHKLVMQGDGNLAFYDKNNSFIWANGSNGRGLGPWYLKMQTDGNLVVTDSQSGKPVWSSKGGLLCVNTCGGESTQSSNCSCTCPTGKIYNTNTNSCVCSTTCPAGVAQSTLDCSCTSDSCRSDVNTGISTVGIGNTNNSCPSVLTSPNKKYRLEVQPDGNLTVIDQTPGQTETAIWRSGSSQPFVNGKYLYSPYYLKQQPEGHLVLYNSGGGPIWYTNKYGVGKAPFFLKIFDDGSFGTYDSTGYKLYNNKTG